MKIDLKKLKKVSSDKEKTVLMHPKGHKIVVAHKGLSKPNLEALSKLPAMYKNPSNVEANPPAFVPNFAEGGDVDSEPSVFEMAGKKIKQKMLEPEKAAEPEDLPEADVPMTGDELEALERGYSIEGGASIPEEKVSSEDIKEPSRNPSSKEETIEPANEQEKAAARQAILQAREQSAKRFGMPKKMLQEIDKYAVPVTQQSPTNVGTVGAPSPRAKLIEPEEAIPQRSPQGVPGEAPEVEPVAPTPALPQVEAPKGVIPKQVPQGLKGDIFAPAFETKLKAAQLAEKAGMQKAQAETGLAEQQFKAYDVMQSRLNMIAAEQQKALNDQIDERAKRIKDVEAGAIDPYKIIREMSTGDKILASVGLILGGMGAGLTGQPNLAYEIMKDAINKDIDAQAKNLGIKENLLSNSMKFYGDVLSAKKDLASMYMTMTNQILERAKVANLPYQKVAEITALQSSLLGDIAKMEQEVAMRQALKSAMTKGGEGAIAETTGLLRTLGPEGQKAAEDIESKYVPGIGKATVAVPQSARQEMIKRQDLDHKLMDLINFSKENSGSWNPATIKAGKAKANLVSNAIREAGGMGVIKEAEVKFMESLIADPTQIWAKWRAQKGYQEVLRDNRAALESLMKGYGLQMPAAMQPEAKPKMPPPPSGQVYMRGPDGTLGTIPKQNVKKALERGFTHYKAD